MSTAGIVTIFLGVLIILSRGPLLLFPALALRWFGEAIKTKARTRILGAIIAMIALPMIWSGISENTGLAAVLFLFGVFFLVVAIPTMVLFPNIYMSIAESLLPDGSGGNLFGWRILGLVSVIIGVAIFQVGVAAL